MSEDTKTREIFDSFLPSEDNYEKTVESLKLQFGRDDLLIDECVRIRLKLVVQIATESNNKMNNNGLYDKLESCLRESESIELTSDKYPAMLAFSTVSQKKLLEHGYEIRVLLQMILLVMVILWR